MESFQNVFFLIDSFIFRGENCQCASDRRCAKIPCVKLLKSCHCALCRGKSEVLFRLETLIATFLAGESDRGFLMGGFLWHGHFLRTRIWDWHRITCKTYGLSPLCWLESLSRCSTGALTVGILHFLQRVTSSGYVWTEIHLPPIRRKFISESFRRRLSGVFMKQYLNYYKMRLRTSRLGYL